VCVCGGEAYFEVRMYVWGWVVVVVEEEEGEVMLVLVENGGVVNYLRGTFFSR
jgi:hypothetical protein